MALTNRWVCEAAEELDFNDAKKKLKGFFASTDGTKHRLKRMVHLLPEVSGEDELRFLLGTIYFQIERKLIATDITEKGELKTREETRLETLSAPFTIASNPGLILFNNAQEPAHLAKEIMSDILFGQTNLIGNLSFDIARIEGDVLKGKLDGMWTFSFCERKGNIRAGIVYGDDVNQDSMYGECVGSPRNFIGVIITGPGSKLKTRISRNGSVTIYADWNRPEDTQRVYDILRLIRPYAIVR